MNRTELKGVVADEVFRTGITSDRNRAVLDLIAEHAEMAALLARWSAWVHHSDDEATERGDDLADETDALLARIQGEAE